MKKSKISRNISLLKHDLAEDAMIPSFGDFGILIGEGNEINIYGSHEILAYGKESVCIDSASVTVCVEGSEMILKKSSSSHTVITGNVEKISFRR